MDWVYDDADVVTGWLEWLETEVAIMTRFIRPKRETGHGGASVTSRALLATFLWAASGVALAQDQSAATPKDTIFARKIMMDAISRNMDELEGMTSSAGAINLPEGREHADAISVMLMAFPHLFPPSTNLWKPNVDRDPGRDTYASPDVWTKFADFYAKAANASKVAYNASRAEHEVAFKTFVASLRTACDSCHAVYLKNE
jgi:cytochrome c556